jgi:uncharacterized membrane-anchored protein YitT (DUF2179 family)
MDTTWELQRRRIASVVAIVFITVGGLLCFFALVHRIDGPDDFRGTLIWDLLIGIPIAVGVWFKTARKRGVFRSGMVAFGIWAVIASVFIAWHCQQIAARGGTDILRQWLQDFWHSL